MTFRIKKLIIGIVLSLITTGAYSQTDFVVGTENLKYLPFTTTDKGKATGYFKDILDKFGETKGYTFTLSPMPVKRLMNSLITDKIDFKIPDNPIWASSLKTGKNIAYSDPTTVYLDGILVLPANKGRGYEKLSSMVTVRGFTPFIFLDDISKGSIKLQETTDLKAVINMTVAKRAEGAFANVTVAERYMKDELRKPGALVFDNDIPAAKSDISLSTTLHPKIIEEFNAFLQSHAQWISDLKQANGVP
ncbi:hypothetical protein A9Q99_18810 [Gammaproteobacteria bacterium 45_16_T64]|nr:hypothetical protein A9Q99_18810 [Gammaproteobacteria bacterium 45_16_T64]